jgi:hypothetical protein
MLTVYRTKKFVICNVYHCINSNVFSSFIVYRLTCTRDRTIRIADALYEGITSYCVMMLFFFIFLFFSSKRHSSLCCLINKNLYCIHSSQSNIGQFNNNNNNKNKTFSGRIERNGQIFTDKKRKQQERRVNLNKLIDYNGIELRDDSKACLFEPCD